MKSPVFALCLLAPALSVAAAEPKPDILVILADDMGYSDLGCYGSGIDTPHLDALAAAGLRFSSFYNTGRCCPSRASLVTGLYSHQAGVGHMLGKTEFPAYSDGLRAEATTIPERLRAAGYRTYMSGKWHLGWADDGAPDARGFDRFYGSRGYVDSYFDIVPRTDIYLDGEIVNPAGRPPMNHLHPERAFYTTETYTDYALHFLAEHPDDRPFFLYLAYNAPHFPLHALPEDTVKYRGRFRDGGWDPLRRDRFDKLRAAGLIDPATELSARDSPDWDSLSDAVKDELDLKFALYCGIVDRLDRNVGRVIACLRERGRLDNTLVVFLSDNGSTKETGMFGIGGHDTNPGNYAEWGRKGGWTSSLGQGWANVANTPFRRYKRENHEGGIAAPCIAHWPAGLRTAPGAVTHQVAHIIDLMPTFAELAGADATGAEGRSLVPVLRGQPAFPRLLHWEHEGNRAILDDHWKLVAGRGEDWQLHDLRTDRAESHDLAAAQPDRVRALADKWQAWADRVGVRPWPEVEASRKRLVREAQGK